MRDTFVKTLIELAKKDKNIELVTGDLGFGVLKPYWEQLPEQFINAGIAEQNMTTMAAGMALEGKTVFTYSIGNFPTIRCLEQIRNDCAYHNANVKIVCVGGGFVYGSLGMSHHATEDLALLRTCYLRPGRGGEKRIHDKIENFQIGKAIKINDGEKVALFSAGAIFDEVQEACKLLNEEGINPALYTFPTIKPIDKDVIEKYASEFDYVVTVEEHNIVGGFGGAVSEVMAEMKNKKAQLIRIGLNDIYSSIVGSQKYLRDQYGMSAKKIAQRVMDVMKND